MITSRRVSARDERTSGVVVSWLALVVAVLTLHAAGGVLPAPPLGAPSQWLRWMAGRDPVVVAFGLVRLAGLGVAWYGLIVTAAGVGLRLVSARNLTRLVDRLTVAPLRRLVAATVTVGISVSALGVTTAGAVTATGPRAAPVVSTTTLTGAAGPPAGPPATITMHRLDAADTEPPAPQPSPPAPAPPVSTSPRPDPVPTPTWTVEAGQCFWSIAEAHLGKAWGRRPTAAEIVPYWHKLIEANRGMLSDPHNADLVFPGQVFSLPAP